MSSSRNRKQQTPFGTHKQLSALLSYNNAVKSSNRKEFNQSIDFGFSPKFSSNVLNKIINLELRDNVNLKFSFFDKLFIRTIYFNSMHINPKIINFIERGNINMDKMIQLREMLKGSHYYITPLNSPYKTDFVRKINSFNRIIDNDNKYIRSILNRKINPPNNYNILQRLSEHKNQKDYEMVKNLYNTNNFLFNEIKESGYTTKKYVSRKARSV
jgi:hypothetical protein